MSAFICKICGDCCKGEGSVFLYPEDVKRIAENLSMTVQQVVEKYTEYVMMEIIEKSGSYLYLPYLILKKNKGTCVFSNSNMCEIHKFKPFQCAHTPFVSEFFSDNHWRNQLKRSCPALKNMKDSDYAVYAETGEKSEKTEKEYYYLLRENGFNLEKILNITLEAPKIITNND